MLAFVICVLCSAGLVKCSAGYYDYEGGRCVTREECVETYHRRVRGSECVEEDMGESSNSDSQYRDDSHASASSTSVDNLIPKASISCGNNYVDKTGATERCVTRKGCTGIPYDKGKLCLPDDEYKNWNSYKVYLYVSGKDK